ncbi:MAG: hypothetical protein KatS3mg053_3146 [Candidatus Roseilinea sp.]|nr:MAG: hypothetical protein KatS3mg053_3146 [Candidatus Roseilinea sp.]
MRLPYLIHNGVSVKGPRDSIAFVVYAPFGADGMLSTYPDGASHDLSQHPLMQNLLGVAACGVHVVALVDRVNSDTYLIQIPAARPADLQVTSRWKLDMASPRTLAGLLRYASEQYPTADLVLSLEGHGAGFLPDIDRAQLSVHNLTDDGKNVWLIRQQGSVPLPQGSPILPEGSPILPQGSPILPQGSPILPAGQMPMSTYGLGRALKDALDAGAPKPAVIHFNNCFNLSVEVLHTIAPYAGYAVGYPNYNFFTAGAAYPEVFARLKKQKATLPVELARWFAEENHAVLAAKGNHPTAGGVVELACMHEIVERIDDLADALLVSLRNASGAARARVADDIQAAIVKAQQYDTTHSDFTLEAPDEMTDLRSLAAALDDPKYAAFGVQAAARALWQATDGIKAYGDADRPWVNFDAVWDFRGDLAMNIFLPDPLRKGLWDWRSPYYLDVNPDPSKPRVQPHIIDFVKITDWVDFIIEYHKDTPFVGLLPAQIPDFPAFNAKFEPPRKPDRPDQKPPDTPNEPYQRSRVA